MNRKFLVLTVVTIFTCPRNSHGDIHETHEEADQGHRSVKPGTVQDLRGSEEDTDQDGCTGLLHGASGQVIGYK